MSSKVFGASTKGHVTIRPQGAFAVLRVALAGLVLTTALVGVAAGSASAQSYNPADALQAGPNISARALCRVDGQLVVWHPPMLYGSNCFDFQILSSQ